MTPLRLGMVVFAVDALVLICLGLRRSSILSQYLERHHPEAYRRMVLNFGSNLTWGGDSIARFVFLSSDDLGDEHVASLKRSLRWTLYAFLLNGIAALAFFGIIAALQP